jgi:hypothetical protein
MSQKFHGLKINLFFLAISSAQRSPVHSFQREAIQVQRLRQGFLSVTHAGRAQGNAPRGGAAQVPHLQSQLQPARQPQNAHADPHERGAAAAQPRIARAHPGPVAKVIDAVAAQEPRKSHGRHHQQETARLHDRRNYETIKCV